MKTVISEPDCVSIQAAEHIKKLLAEKPDAVIALSVGKSQQGLFRRLAELYGEKMISFSKARFFVITELVGAEQEKSYRYAFKSGLADKTDISAEKCFFPDMDNYEQLDEKIEELGGIDLAVLGIGVNAHIGFNEPATPFDSRTHIQKLTNATRRQLADRFGGEDSVPEKGITLGIKTIIRARDIIVLAFGDEKAEAVFRMVYGRTEPYIPASYLQIPISVTAYIDRAAGAKL